MEPAELRQPNLQPTTPDALQIERPAEISLRQTPTDSEGVLGGNAQGEEIAGTRQAQVQQEEVALGVSDQQRFDAIKSKKPSQRTDEEIEFANAFSKKQRDRLAQTQAGPPTRAGFLSGNSATTQGKLKSALAKQITHNGLKTTVGDLVESLFNQGWRMAIDARGHRQFTDGQEALGTTGIGKVGINYADYLSSKPELVSSQAAQVALVPSPKAALAEEKRTRGDELPVTDDKAPVTEGDPVVWQDENGVVQEGVLTKVNAGRGSLGEPVSEVTLEDSSTVQVPRRELQPLMASSRGNPVQASRAEAIESLRGHLGKEVSVGVSAVDAINGAAELQGDVPGVQKVWVGTSGEFLADEGLRKAFPQVNKAMTSPDSSRFEGLFSGGRAFVFTDNVGIYEGDIELAAQEGMPPGQAAVQRVITHEALVHRGFYALDKPTRQALLRWGEQNIYEGEMDAKAEEYGVGANWRSDVGSREWLMEEIMAKMIERLKAPPKSGPLKQLWDILASLWRKLTGRSREVTLKDIHDVAKLLRTALELAENNVQTRDGMPIKVEVVKPSMREMIIYRAGDANENGVKPWASFTPDEDTAKSYTDNPGFGGDHLRSLRVDAGNVLDLTGSRAFEKLASALGYDRETAQEWRDNGWNYPWEESSKIKRALEDSEYDAVKYTDDFPAGATTIVFTRQPQQVDDVKPSIRPTYTSPLDQTLANTAKAVRLMRDGPPAVPVNLQEVYRKAQVGKSSAMVSLDDMFAEAKKAHPDLTEAEFGQQVQALYDDNGAYIEPAESPTVMREAGEKYNVRTQGVPASYVMVLDDVPPRASLAPETAARLNRVVEAAQTASGDITE